MKKILLISIFATSIFAGNMFSKISGMTMPEVNPENAYTLDTAGLNPRVYEFVPKGDPTKLCVVVFPNADGANTAAIPAMQCFSRGK
jgi:hypothetical protein